MHAMSLHLCTVVAAIAVVVMGLTLVLCLVATLILDHKTNRYNISESIWCVCVQCNILLS